MGEKNSLENDWLRGCLHYHFNCDFEVKIGLEGSYPPLD